MAPCIAHHVTLVLKAGQTVNEAVTGGLAASGFRSGYVHLENMTISPLRYVIPAPAPDETHVAWYSDTRAPEGVVTIEQAGAVAGSRDGAPFIHCHGVWRDADSERRGGHLLPHDSVIAADVEVTGWGIDGAGFVARPDAETNFTLFAPEPLGSSTAEMGGKRALACTVRPNGDISQAIETVCKAHGFVRASVLGVGSLAGVDFADGRHVPFYATEVMIVDGHLDERSGCRLEVALVDMEGDVHEGLLVTGLNPVCVTFELLIVEVQ